MENQNENIKKIINTVNVLIIVIIGVSVILFLKLNTVEQKLNQINSVVQYSDDVTIDYSQIREIVAEELQNQTYLNVQAEWASEYKDDKIFLDCSVILNESKENDIVKILYKSEEDANWKSEVLEKGSALNYTGSITLDLFTEYEYYIILEGETQQASKVTPIPREYYLIKMNFVHGGEVGINGNGEEESVLIHWNQGVEKCLIKGLSFELYKIRVYSADKVIDTIVIEDLFDVDSTEIFLKDYEETVDKITAVATLSDGQDLEKVIYTNSDERAIEEEKFR